MDECLRGPAGAVTSGLRKSGWRQSPQPTPLQCPAASCPTSLLPAALLGGPGAGAGAGTPTEPRRPPRGSRKGRRPPHPPVFSPSSAKPRPGAQPGRPRELSHFLGVNYHCLESELRRSGHNKPCGRVGALGLSRVTAAGPGQNCPHSGGATSPGDPSCLVVSRALQVEGGDRIVEV